MARSAYTISATATDEDGTFAAGNTVGVTVNNVAPTLAISGAASVNEGSTYTLNLSKSDPGADTINHWTINWGDGTQVVSGSPASVTHVYADGDDQLHDQRDGDRRGRHVRGRQHGGGDRAERGADGQRRRPLRDVRRHADHAHRHGAPIRPGRPIRSRTSGTSTATASLARPAPAPRAATKSARMSPTIRPACRHRRKPSSCRSATATAA